MRDPQGSASRDPGEVRGRRSLVPELILDCAWITSTARSDHGTHIETRWGSS
jgi:hypothetical protein